MRSTPVPGIALLLALLIANACGVRTDGAAASATPSLTTPTSRAVPFPSLPVIVGTAAGDVYFELRTGAPAGAPRHVCDGPISRIAAYGRQAAIRCGSGPRQAGLYLWDEASGGITRIADTEVDHVAFDGINSLAYVTIGRSEPSAPISMTKLMLRDLRTGATSVLDERYGVAFDLRLTGRGVAVWRPKNSQSFVRPDAEAGSWIIIDKTLVRWSAHRLIEGSKGWDLLESEPAGGSSGPTYVVWKMTTEERLTPAIVADEKAVAITNDLRAVAWRPERGPFEGSMVIYRGATIERTDPGRFSAFNVMRSGDWVVGFEYSGAPSLTLHAYRLSDGAFAAQPANGFTALALLGAPK